MLGVVPLCLSCVADTFFISHCWSVGLSESNSCPELMQFYKVALIACLLIYFYFLLTDFRGRGWRERETLICCSTYLYIPRLLLV